MTRIICMPKDGSRKVVDGMAEDTGSRVETPWFHMEPDITRAVISKAEEELLSSLSALMRNRVENEKLQRQMTASMQAIDDAKKEHVAIKNQIRSDGSSKWLNRRVTPIRPRTYSGMNANQNPTSQNQNEHLPQNGSSL